MSPFAQDVESLKLASCGWLAGESSRERQFVSPAPWRPAARPVPSTTTACPSRVKGRSMRAAVSAQCRWTEVPTARPRRRGWQEFIAAIHGMNVCV